VSTLLQIVPRVPGGLDGVGDHALTIARKLRENFGCDTVFATFKPLSPEETNGFDVLPLDTLLQNSTAKFDHVLFHYVNYGFQKRGVPFRLLSILRSLRQPGQGRLVTIFHELYASGPPWTSAFWLRPLQIDLARQVARMSDTCIVSTDNFRRELRRMVPHAEIALHPIPSGLGEPFLSANQIAHRDPQRWAIFGGTGLVERSLRAFLQILPRIPNSIAPHSMFVLGGEENPATQSLLVDLVRRGTDSPGRGIESDYRPRIAAADASEILETCAFAFFDYFHRPDVETSIILKSSAFASACAHAVIPVLPHRGSPIAMDGDALPGPFFIDGNRAEIPGEEARARIATEIYAWYQRHVASEHLVRTLAEMMGLHTAR
jgi:hypothetical protein